MKLKKCIALTLCVLLLVTMLPTSLVTLASSSEAHGYYNANYLEDYAAAAYGEQGLGAVYSPSSTTWKLLI